MQQPNQVNSGGENGAIGAALAPPGATGATGTATTAKTQVNGGRFDFDDGGTYCGGWEEGKAHGHGVCTGPKGQGAYSGSWHYGFEVSGVYTWPSGSAYEGQWQNGKRHGLGVETRGRWIYRGEWTQGFKGRYGVRQSNTSTAKYEGTWANGLQDGYGAETYADDGTYQGQWLRGMRHGYGVRNSAPFGKASKYRTNKAIRASLTSLRSNEGGSGGANPETATEKRDRRVDDLRGGFVLKMSSAEPTVRRRSLGSSNIKKTLFMGIKITRQKSTGELEKKGAGSGSIRSTGSTASWVSTDSAQSVMTSGSIPSDSNASFVVEDEHLDPGVTETYMGEWKNDKRSGFGISERSDGLKYEGEWYGNKKYGYGVTTFSNGEKEEGKYKNNVLITSQKKKHLFLMRSAKFRERIDAAVNAAQRASKIALQKADIAISRSETARAKAKQADIGSEHARTDSDIAQEVAKQYAPDFKQPGLDRLRAAREKYRDKFIDSYNQKDVTNTNIPNHQMQNDISAATVGANQLHSQMPNQIPNQVPNQIPNQIPNQLLKTNVISTPDHNYYKNTSDSYQQNPPTNPNLSQHNNPNNPTSHYGNPNTLSNPNNLINDQQNPNPNSKSVNINDELGLGTKAINSLPTSDDNIGSPPVNSTLRRASRRVSGDRPYLGGIQQQSSIDHFDHYKRPPSRDSSVDRYSRATRMSSSMGSRQPSVDRSSRPSETPDRGMRAPSAVRGTTPAPSLPKNGSVLMGNSKTGVGNNPGPPTQPPFEEIIIRKRGLGQDIIPSPNQPKRTESLFISHGAAPPPPVKNLAAATPLQRKKSLPDFQGLPKATEAMSREEVSYLGSARREEIRRQVNEQERLRANPLLYLVSPQVKDWFSRQQLVIIVLFVNISLAIMFFKLLT